MRILAINGSYRKNGNTAKILEMIAAQLQQCAAENRDSLQFEEINLGHQNLQFCRGCRVCFDKGESKCPLDDELLSIRAKMQATDGLILASPVYVNDINGITKNWIDRLAFVCHRPEFAGKSAYLIATVGDGPTSHALRSMKMALSFWGYHIVGQDSYKMGARMRKMQAQTQFQKQASRAAKKLFQAIQLREANKPSFISLMTFRIQQAYWQQRPEDISIDHLYWKSQGWTNPGQDYYIVHNVGRFKVILARLAGALLAPFVI